MTDQKINFRPVVSHPLMIVLSGLSGAGKDSVLRQLKKRISNLHFVVTVNSRTPRADEKEGVDYFFISRAKFEDMIKNDELIEYAHVYQDYKGVPRQQVINAIASGKDVILRLDFQGAKRIRELYPEAILIFIMPGCEEEWVSRLDKRGTESAADLQLRIETAKKELDTLQVFDYLVYNNEGKLEDTVNAIEGIIQTEHMRVHPRRITV